MLRVDRLNIVIQGSHILRDVTLRVGPGELVCVLGRNGAGKTTTLRAIMGYLKPAGGTIEFKGRRLDGLPTHGIAALGIGFAPEDAGIFASLSVGENIAMATWTRSSSRPAAERVERAYAVCPTLRRHTARGGGELSGGERKLLSIARALALDPDLLVLDEPLEGLSPAIIPAIGESITGMSSLGLGILLAESNIRHVPEAASRLYVLERGEIIFAGALLEARRDRAILRIIGGR